MAITKQKIHQIQQREGNRRAAYSAAMSQVKEKERKKRQVYRKVAIKLPCKRRKSPTSLITEENIVSATLF
jgi:hypothetical protein